jgi:hypothetical protein
MKNLSKGQRARKNKKNLNNESKVSIRKNILYKIFDFFKHKFSFFI